ncbi:hypothetical protein K461DRAFT_281847, partial [Myriangium duriaei CBS 260.36]
MVTTQNYMLRDILQEIELTSRYDHTRMKASDPVRSPVNKHVRDSLVVAWVTSSESGLLYF